ncbi:19306_t:CDS:2, partial [Entrophospora sp. SA101]
VAYEAPGERQAAKGLHLSGPSAVPYEQLSVWHIEQLLTLFTWAFIMGLITSWCYLCGYAVSYEYLFFLI